MTSLQYMVYLGRLPLLRKQVRKQEHTERAAAESLQYMRFLGNGKEKQVGFGVCQSYINFALSKFTNNMHKVGWTYVKKCYFS